MKTDRPKLPAAPPARAAAPLALALALALAPAAARAQSATEAAARAELIDQARAARQAGDHARALDLAERAGRIQMSTSLRMFIAQEQSDLGRFAAAMVTAEACAREAQADAALRNREAILDVCRGLAADARARVARVTVNVPSPAPAGLTVTIAGATISDALYGVAVPVDPGTVAVEAAADGHPTFRRELRLRPGGAESVSVTWDEAQPAGGVGAVEANAGASAGASQPGGASAGASTPAGTGAEPSAPARGEAQDAGGTHVPLGAVAVAGAGVVALGVAAALFVVRNNALGDFQNQYCGGGLDCEDTPASRAAYSSLQAYNVGTNVALAVGGAALVGGVAWFIFGRSSGDPAQAPRASVSVAPLAGGALLTVGGSL